MTMVKLEPVDNTAPEGSTSNDAMKCDPPADAMKCDPPAAVNECAEVGSNKSAGAAEGSPFVVCRGCDLPIDDGDYLKADGKFWHRKCFFCKGCHIPLADIVFPVDKEIFCEKCYLRTHGIKCTKCDKYIVGRMMSAHDRRYHPECFCCEVCDSKMQEGEQYVLYNNQLQCITCNTKLTSKKGRDRGNSHSKKAKKKNKDVSNTIQQLSSSPNSPKATSMDEKSASGRRTRTFINAEALQVLVESFRQNPLPSKEERDRIIGILNLPNRVIQVWFQNQRAKQRKMQEQQVEQMKAAQNQDTKSFTLNKRLPFFKKRGRHRADSDIDVRNEGRTKLSSFNSSPPITTDSEMSQVPGGASDANKDTMVASWGLNNGVQNTLRRNLLHQASINSDGTDHQRDANIRARAHTSASVGNTDRHNNFDIGGLLSHANVDNNPALSGSAVDLRRREENMMARGLLFGDLHELSTRSSPDLRSNGNLVNGAVMNESMGVGDVPGFAPVPQGSTALSKEALEKMNNATDGSQWLMDRLLLDDPIGTPDNGTPDPTSGMTGPPAPMIPTIPTFSNNFTMPPLEAHSSADYFGLSNLDPLSSKLNPMDPLGGVFSNMNYGSLTQGGGDQPRAPQLQRSRPSDSDMIQVPTAVDSHTKVQQ